MQVIVVLIRVANNGMPWDWKAGEVCKPRSMAATKALDCRVEDIFDVATQG